MAGPPAPDQQIPPELLMALGGGGGPMGPPGPPPMAEPPPGPTPGPPPGPGNPLDVFKQMLEDALAPVDAEESAGIAKIMAIIADLIKKQAKEQDAAMGTSPAQKFMRRQAVSGA